ncbi:MAG TPA: hypothetical protein VLD57_11105, partial [Blastocatellia bacterium]|nr:hypothetical protein [Blastocatellia bacterium]
MDKTERAFARETQVLSREERDDLLAGDREGLTVNISSAERWCSALSGVALAIYGLRLKGYGGATVALLGGGLIYRAATGHSFIY